jgi:capsular polysaccharide biosynthesis protein
MNVNQKQFIKNRDEISLVDIYLFLKKSYKTILFFGVVGLIFSFLYILWLPNLYEATAKIQMWKISSAINSNAGNGNNTLGVNIEEPAALIGRMSLVSIYTSEVAGACSLNSSSGGVDGITQMVRLTQPKGLPNIVELKVIARTSKVAEVCATAIFELIKKSQKEIVDMYINSLKSKISDNEARINKARNLVSGADKLNNFAISSEYFFIRDEVNFLRSENSSLSNLIMNSQQFPTYLLAPVYASETPVAPKKIFLLLTGMIAGLITGVLISLAHKFWSSLRLG